jgi:CheY-like chemotaxis protein
LTRLQGLRVLIVEDETIIAMLLEDILTDAGCVVAGKARSVAAALDAVETLQFDVAILDVNLRGRRVDPVADALMDRRLPFIFATGYGEAGLAERFRSITVLQKPFEPTPLLEMLAREISDSDSRA